MRDNRDKINPFPEKRPDVQQLDRLGFNPKTIEPMVAKIMQFLMTKAIHEQRKQDKNNPTRLGNVLFHIDYNDITKQTRLVFDKHPKLWKEDEIVSEMNNMEADIMMEKQANRDILDNPFTF